MKERGWNK